MSNTILYWIGLGLIVNTITNIAILFLFYSQEWRENRKIDDMLKIAAEIYEQLKN